MSYPDPFGTNFSPKIFVGATRHANLLCYHFGRPDQIFGHSIFVQVEAYTFHMQGVWITRVLHYWPVIVPRAFLFPQPQFQA
jgi:hypothetical protein